MKKMRFLTMVLVLVMLLAGCDSSDYKKATALYDEGSFLEAAAMFEALGDYENSRDMVPACKYAEAKRLYSAAEYDAAEQLFAVLGGYEDSKNLVLDCKYQKANALYGAGDYEGAIAIYEIISDYSDCAQRLADAKKELMYLNYGDVIERLSQNTWYFNGGSDSVLNVLRFSDEEAIINQCTSDGNGTHPSADKIYSYLVDAENIIITLADGSEMEIPYSFDGVILALGSGEYLTEQQVEEGLNGYWKLRNADTVLGMRLENEYNIYFENGHVVSENAAKSDRAAQGYFYYGPHEGSYSVKLGCIDTDLRNGTLWSFNVIDGKVTVLHGGKACTPSNGFPGEHGYHF